MHRAVALSKSVRNREPLFGDRCDHNGWMMEAIGTSASTINPGDVVTFNVSASRTEDGAETVDIPIDVQGGSAGVDSITLSAAVTGVDTASFDVVVAEDTSEVTITAACADKSFDVAVEDRTGSLILSGVNAREPEPGVVVAEATVECSGGGCDAQTLTITVGGELVFQNEVGPLAGGETVTEKGENAFDTSGTLDVIARLGDQTANTTITISVDGGGGGGGGGDARPVITGCLLPKETEVEGGANVEIPVTVKNEGGADATGITIEVMFGSVRRTAPFPTVGPGEIIRDRVNVQAPTTAGDYPIEVSVV